MASLYDSLLTQTCQITEVLDGEVNEFGEPVRTTNIKNASAACSIQKTKADVSIARTGKMIKISHYGYFKVTEDIAEDDIVLYKSEEYLVVMLEDEAGVAHHYKTCLKKVS